ncbi:hypothetical protein HRG_008754 [Hirsutella rhossiliensis]|uniref:Zn(2)-C6 fungal-type domain-containing protein n=1 Tax=Hirsutella rhossiliensis TaxID=111463 RepID=A0A9P8MUD0_9HYPO|nr:uncharacterized protein HRG_08754 [Hirsutella rhossiliensis]KAH0960599.1 hypothetical protein HRG_08754 [Hirsutella rhossiliensis]
MSDAGYISSNDARDTPSDTATERRCDAELGADVAKIRQDKGRTLRKSCDRCHQQKLRCIGGGRTTLTRCLRCQRAGAECVYSARCNKQSHRNKNDACDYVRVKPLSAKSDTSRLADIETGFDPHLMNCDDLFTRLPSWDTASLAGYTMPLPPSSGFLDVSLSAGEPFSISSSSATPELDCGLQDSASDLPGRLANVCQALEAAYTKVLGDQATQATQDCPITEAYGVFDRFLAVLMVHEMAAIMTPRIPQTPSDEYMRTKLASMAVHGYVLCMKLMRSFSEQVLLSLLATPLPASRLSLSGPRSSDAPRLGARAHLFSGTGHVPNNPKLGDMYVSMTDPFQHVLNSKLNILETGSKLLSNMEHLLGIPPDLGGGSLSSASRSSEQVVLDSHVTPSLPARLVASIWEDDASINNTSVVAYFRRCRAAILGLADVASPAHQ